MKQTITLLMLLAFVPAFSQFPTKIVYDVNDANSDKNATMTLYINRDLGMRFEVALEQQEGFKMTTLKLFSKPNVLIMINDKAKTWSEMNLPSNSDKKSDNGKTYTVQLMGQEKIAGTMCKKARIRDSEGEYFDYWCAMDYKAVDLQELYKNIGGLRGSNFAKQLLDNGLTGLMMKVITYDKKGKVTAIIEATEVGVNKPLSTLFEVPADYKKTMLAVPGLENLSPEQQKIMEEMQKKIQNRVEDRIDERKK